MSTCPFEIFSQQPGGGIGRCREHAANGASWPIRVTPHFTTSGHPLEAPAMPLDVFLFVLERHVSPAAPFAY